MLRSVVQILCSVIFLHALKARISHFRGFREVLCIPCLYFLNVFLLLLLLMFDLYHATRCWPCTMYLTLHEPPS
uniref:Uncharacterized protein n=1 Tax=Anopheles darlingi TaxID=43151 RepID=A0A2M4DDJ1_ANODA